MILTQTQREEIANMVGSKLMEMIGREMGFVVITAPFINSVIDNNERTLTSYIANCSLESCAAIMKETAESIDELVKNNKGG